MDGRMGIGVGRREGVEEEEEEDDDGIRMRWDTG